ncbi:beta-glucosidase [Arthrobacter sp. V4I6]|uniref:glycoside hydrolase family 3 protein n=1 Tax=unclassified Arthrobacter TaxID=235627 RepID=UPI002785062A|nr:MULTISPECIES: glycoside hydrolase family 3 N-terminal domain-containing protein [unclassified Arthrobacter]MDQ0820092.1 beta-glucosidase [Arthrobacter sp. V1I7]MDQ0854274.1 beta-glucosidase [Arthrobacter sp. V4I6]
MSQPDYLNPSLTAEQRVNDLLPRMMLEEKAGLLFQPVTRLPEEGYSDEEARADARASVQDKLLNHLHVLNGTKAAEIAEWTNELQGLAADTRLGIPITFSTDPRSGFRSTPFTGQSTDELSRWPEHTGLAAIGDTDLAYQYGDTLRQEQLAMGIRVYLGPMADLYSEPRWSRGFGTFGEDVDMVSRLTAAFIRGLRGSNTLGPESVAAVVKHFPGAGPQLRGDDAHDKRFPEQVYPGGQQQLHLRPFEAAFEAGVTQIMPYYGMPVGTDWQERGFAFNEPVIRDLLRGKYRFEGIVLSDWFLLEPTIHAGLTFGPNGYGLEDLTPTERLVIGIGAGVDQFGGDSCTWRVLQAVRDGQLDETQVNRSVARLLREKFTLGLFENRYVDVEHAHEIGTNPEFRARGNYAQAASLTLLKNGDTMPLRAGTRVYSEGIDWSTVEHDLEIVGTPAHAEVNLVRLDAPWQPDPDNALGDFFHRGQLDFPQDTVKHIAELAAQAPTIAAIYLERPAVVTELLPHLAGLIGEFGASDQVLADALRGRTPFTGKLPFDLPSSMTAIEISREDVPFDTENPSFSHGHGITVTPATL